jgi:phage terminase small subunit
LGLFEENLSGTKNKNNKFLKTKKLFNPKIATLIEKYCDCNYTVYLDIINGYKYGQLQAQL